MAAPVLTFRDSAGDPLTAPVVLTAEGGIPGTPVELQVTLDSGDDTRDSKLIGYARDPSAVVWERVSHEWTTKGIPQARIVSGLGGLAVSATPWTSLGAGSFLPLPDMEAGQGIVFEARLSPPADTTIVVAQVHFSFVNDRGLEVGAAVSKLIGDGIHLPLRDASGHALVYIGGSVVENPGGADDQVQIPQLVWIGGGIPWGKYIHLRQLNNLDSAAAALVAGDAYKARLTAAADGTITVTKGVKAVAASAVAPDWPAGEIRLATVTRAFDGLINNVDIEQAASLDLFGFSSASLTATIGAGRNALIDGSLIYSTAPSQATLTASDTNQIFALRDGNLDVTDDGTKPDPRALLIHEAVTDGSGVTTHRDRRQFIGYSPGELIFEWLGALSATTHRYAHAPAYSDLLVLPCRGVTFSIATQAVTPASGGTVADLAYSTNGGGAWTSLFATSANRPTVAYNATGAALVQLAVYPEAFVIPAGALIRATIAAIPAGAASPPENACLILRFAL